MRKYERIDILIKRLQKDFYNEHEEETKGKVMLEIVEETDIDDNEILDFNIHIVDSKGVSYTEDIYASFNLDEERNQEKVFFDLVVKRNIDLLPW